MDKGHAAAGDVDELIFADDPSTHRAGSVDAPYLVVIHENLQVVRRRVAGIDGEVELQRLVAQVEYADGNDLMVDTGFFQEFGHISDNALWKYMLSFI